MVLRWGLIIGVVQTTMHHHRDVLRKGLTGDLEDLLEERMIPIKAVTMMRLRVRALERVGCDEFGRLVMDEKGEVEN